MNRNSFMVIFKSLFYLMREFQQIFICRNLMIFHFLSFQIFSKSRGFFITLLWIIFDIMLYSKNYSIHWGDSNECSFINIWAFFIFSAFKVRGFFCSPVMNHFWHNVIFKNLLSTSENICSKSKFSLLNKNSIHIIFLTFLPLCPISIKIMSLESSSNSESNFIFNF